MNREISKLVADIGKSISMIEQYLDHTPTFAKYKGDAMIMDAVQRRLSIIGDALWKANKIDPAILVSDKKRIISLRHILVHDYDLVDDATIWLICQKHLPVLKQEVELILNSKEK